MVEIIVMDDASIPEYININTKIEKYNNVSFIKLRDNIGRSCIRNLLASKATYNYILFLDGDSSIKPDFLDRYIKAIETDTYVICGGTIYTDTCPDPHKMLHWKAGKFRESHSVEQRIKNTYQNLTSNNFVIKRDIFEHISFDEKIKKYGHEDTLFGIDLELKNIHIKHIDNPVIHLGIDLNKDYLKKTEQAIENLVQLLREPKYKIVLSQRIKLLRYFNWIYKTKTDGLIIFFFTLLKSAITRNLLSAKPSLKLFDFFKIGYLVTTYKCTEIIQRTEL
ncbi:chondroitin polymerase [Saccharicrinis fermentans DSM 9555 = JCM 21142]|uniref:Chondroitin polymerase n=1 Tax=Saccharicrinis fermentans DSM 9555 = JCM 21142 TaxID=869213 RepID=W7Y733_9BACT|nr:chondroitin polymerase [Saccharicrinis fermentans DSM 9555 = JCM 21142]